MTSDQRLLRDLVDERTQLGTWTTLNLIDSWAYEVQAVLDQLDLPVNWSGGVIGIDSLVGTYMARNRLDKLEGINSYWTVKAIDKLLLSFTVDSGNLWPADIHPSSDYDVEGWWWYRLPVRGPVRREIEAWSVAICESGSAPPVAHNVDNSPGETGPPTHTT